MSEAPITQPEKPGRPITNVVKVRLAALVSVMVAIPSVGGYVGYELGQRSANARRGADLATIKRDEDCYRLERQRAQPGQPVIARLGSLTARQQAECGVAWIWSDTSASDPYSHSNPTGDILLSDTEVQLPSGVSLGDNASLERTNAAHPYSTVDQIGDPFGGVMAGLIGDMALLAGAGAALKLVGRRNSPSPPPATEVA